MIESNKIYQGDLLKITARNVLNEERLIAWRSRWAAYQKQQGSHLSKGLLV